MIVIPAFKFSNNRRRVYNFIWLFIVSRISLRPLALRCYRLGAPELPGRFIKLKFYTGV